MADLDFSSEAQPYTPSAPLDFSSQASPLDADKPGLVPQAAGAVGRGFGDILRGAAAGSSQAYGQLKADINRPTDMSVGGEPGIVQDLTEPLAPAAHLLQIGMDVPNIAVQGVVGAFHPLAQPTGAALLKVDPRYSSAELEAMTPEQRKELETSEGEEFHQNVAGVAMAAEGGVRGRPAPEVNAERFAPVPEKSIYTTVVPPETVATGPLADAAVAHSPVGAVLDAFGEGPANNWGIRDLTANFDTKTTIPSGDLKDMAQGQAEVTKGFNEAFQRSAAAQALVQAGPSIASQLADARSFGIIGEGEGGWSGLVPPDEANAAIRSQAADLVEPEPPPPPDIHEVARNIAPEVFEGPNGYDALQTRQDTFRRWIDELSDTRDKQFEANPPLGDQIGAVQSKIDAILGKVNGVEDRLTKTKATQLEDLRDQHDDLTEQSRQIATQDTPDMQRVRGELQKNDYAMRDMAEKVSAAYREARAQIPPDEAAPVTQIAAETPPAEPAAAPELEVATPTPVSAEAAPEAPVAPAEAAPAPERAAPTRPVPENVATDVSQKLVAAGRPAEEANAAGALIQARYEARAARFGGALGTGPELYARGAPEVRAGRVRAAAAERAREYAQAKEQTDSPAFKKWFGDSKVLDADGQPRVVYHGTTADIPEFDKGKLGSTTGARSAEKGFFFSADPAVASSYAVGKNGYETTPFVNFINKATGGLYQKFNESLLRAVGMKSQLEHGENVVPVHLAIKNPLEIDFKGDEYREQSFASLIDRAKADGHDGVVFRNTIDPGYGNGGDHPSDVYVAFEPTQIKSAVGNRGTFDPSDPRILNQSARGKIAFRDGQATITLMKDANASTFIHETGHQWLEELNRDAAHDQAPADLKADAKTVRDYLGVKDGEEITTRQHEKFARSFERYMMEGTAPSKGLADVFAKFKNWLTTIYETVNKLRAPINDDIRQVFDRLLTKPGDEAVIAPDRLDKTLADIHEDDAANTPPEHADPARDTVEQEVVQVAERKAPDLVPDLANGGETGGVPAEAPGNPDGTGPAGSGPGSASNAEESGKVASGGGDAGAEGADLGAATNAGGRTAAGGKPEQPAESATRITEPNSNLIDKAGNVRLDNIDTPEDFKQALRDAADRNNNFLERRRDVVTDAQRASLANAMGTTPDKILGKHIGESFSDSEIKFIEKALADSAKTVHELSVKAATGNEADILKMTEAYVRHDMIQGIYSQATAEAGRSLRALKKSQEYWSAQSLATNELIKQNVNDATGRTLFQMQEIAKKIAAMDDTSQISKFVRDSRKTGLFDWIQAAWINGLISGPLTHLGYTAAGQMFSLFRAVGEVGAAAMVGKIREMGGWGPEDRAHIEEVPHQLYGMMRGSRNGIKASWQAIKSGQVVLPEEVEEHMAGTTGQVVQSHRTIPNPVIGGRTVPIGSTIELPSRLVSAMHSFNWTTFYSQSISGQAFRQAVAEGLNGDAFARRVATLEMSPTDAMIEAASTDANGGALMTRPAYGSFMGIVSRLTNYGIELPNVSLPGGKSVPLGTLRPLKYIDPFVQIAANVQKQALGRGTPLALASKAVRDDLSMKNGGVAFDRTAGRILAGTTFMIAAGGLAAEGILNSSGPTDPRESREWQRVHGMPHGLVVGNLSYDMLRMGNLGLQMSVAADLYHFAHGVSSEDGSKAASELIHAFSQNIMDESAMRGPAELMKAIDESDRYGDAWIRNFASSFVPFSVGMSQIARQVDPYSRQARTTMDAIKAKIPFVSETLQPRYDVWGQPVPNRGWAVTPNQQLLHDPVDEKLLALGYYPSVAPKKIVGVQLNDLQYADFARMSGQLSYRLVSKLLNSPGFDNAKPEEKNKLVEEAIKHAREQAGGVIIKSSMGTTNDIQAIARANKDAEGKGR